MTLLSAGPPAPAVLRTRRRRATGTPKPAVVAAVRVVGRTLAGTLLRVDVRGREHVPVTGPVLLAGNHSGLLDGPLVYFLSPRPLALLTKAEVFVAPLARACGWLRLIPVHRGLADRAALRAGLQQLSEGGALGVFPEGTRGSGTFTDVTDGLAYLALRSGAPVVPIAVRGTLAALPRGRWIPRLRAPVSIVFGPPVTLTAAGDPRARSTLRAASAMLQTDLVAHLERAVAP